VAISTIRRQIQQVHSMAENLEVLSQDRPLRRDPINLRRLAHDVMVKLEELSNRLQITIEIEGDGSVVGDPRLSYIALLNMVRNGVVACRGAGKVRIQLRDGLLVVADQGHGIPQRVLANLFDPIANDRVFGLGATVARICQRRQGGEVRLIRTSDEGTAFGLLWSSRTPRNVAK
jgi:signal transduction histidine kinase